jgi:DNA-binding response OmpR family regulator
MAHILVIDGDRAVGTAIQKALEHEGQVGVAGAGPAGSKAVPSETFDLATVEPGPQP